MMNVKPSLLPFSASKFVNTAQHRFYYAFGNTPAEDLLEHVPDTCKKPSVLQLGCGDIRSCFYTLWKNFDKHSGHGNFKGVTFNLNDYCAAVLARNILFLYWTLKLADVSPGDAQQTVCSIWNVWFCHDLQHHDVVLLRESLDVLLEVFESDEAWKKPDNPLRNVIDFVGEFKQDTMKGIYQMYSFWLKMLQDANDETKLSLKRNRIKVVEKTTQFIELRFNGRFGIYSMEPGKRQNMRKLMMDEYCSYLETGNAFAEHAFGISVTDVNSHVLNPTLYEKENEYTLHYSSMPYECFVHSLFMTKENIHFPPGTIFVQQKRFDNIPLLANSVQQFSMWLISSAKHLQTNTATKFLFCYSDAICAAVRLRHSYRFNIIHSSNLIDHLSSLAVVINTITLLTENGVLLTTTMNLGKDSVNKNVEMSFNFKLEYLLPLFGIRCFGQEGIYAGDGILQAIPSFRAAFEALKIIGSELPRLIIWKSSNATPLLLKSLEEHSLATEALFACIKGATLGFLSLNPTISLSTTSSHSAMIALSIFFNRLSSESFKDFKFWTGLCTRLRNDTGLLPFLMHLQCQATLMNIHMHLTTTPSDCPICNNTLTQYFQKICVPFNASFEVERYSNSASIVLACIHPKEFDTESLNILNPTTARKNKGVFLIDSGVCSVSAEMNGLIDIVIPRNLIDYDKYCATVYAYNYFQADKKFIGSPVSTVPLKNVNIDAYTPHATITNRLQLNPSTSFGELALLEYTGYQYVTNITLSDKVISDLQSKYPLRTEMITDTSFKVFCRNSHFVVKYSTPIIYAKVKIQYSTEKKLVMIDAECKPFDTYSKDQQTPLFFVSPENNIILPQVNVSEFYLEESVSSQMTIEDWKIINLFGRGFLTSSPSINAKNVFIALFQRMMHTYFHLISATKGDDLTYGMIVVHKRLFDVQNQTPALDLSFYINEAGIDRYNNNAFYTWSLMRLSNNVDEEVCIPVNGNEISLVKGALSQFSDRTRICKTKANPLINLGFGMDKYFRRAIAYHLSTDRCELSLEDKFLPFNQSDKKVDLLPETNHCSFCSSEVMSVRKCLRCHSAIYCGEECQRKHWKVHKLLCKPAVVHSSAIAKPISTQIQQAVCSRCKAKSNDLKKCTRCKLVAYCGKQCQIEDWSEHKMICKQAV